MRHFKHFSPIITSCALVAIFSAGLLADKPVMPGQTYGWKNNRPLISLLQPGIASAQAEWETLKFTNAAEELWGGETYITGREVFMRSGPGIDFKPEGFFRFAEPVRIIEDLGEWLKVECRNSGIPVYVHRNYVGSWSEVKDKFIPGSDCMVQIDQLYDCLNMAAPFYTKNLDRERKLKEIDHYQDVLDKTYNYVEYSKLPPQAIKDMLKALDMINGMFNCQKRFVTEPEQAANMRDEAWPDLQAEFRQHYATLEKYR
ncbi:MAG: SH3 domain-containing protein [Acidaminococcaceae bacterium]|nr:SH3 domain-containing protein [Acidaminococcaceae bacterium]MBO6038993.1 SH3 domain-containing protein [Acidaminococcaceae bacterium]